MIFEFTTAKEATGASFADYASLKVRFVTSLNEAAQVAAPEDSVEVFKSFLHWLATDAARARSLESVWRAAGSVMIRTHRANLTMNAEVKLFYERLLQTHGLVHEPMTATTQRMARLVHTVVLPERHSGKPLMLARSQLMFAAEYGGGLRVGEATGGGDNHGLTSDGARICEEIATGKIFVEFVVNHSKTSFQRIVTTVGTTMGEVALPIAQYLRDYWAACGWSTRSWVEGGFRVTCADYFVLRVSLLGIDAARLELLFKRLEASSSAETRRHAPVSRRKGLDRFLLTGSRDKKYVNVVGGPEGCTAIRTTALELSRAGFSEAGRLSFRPGPLLVATEGQGRQTTHMPLDPGSTYEVIRGALSRAYELASAVSPDPQIDLGGRSQPRWSHHSNRRGANTVARASQEATGASEMDIDLTFGWQERFYSQKMQVHYEARFDRKKRAAVTSQL